MKLQDLAFELACDHGYKYKHDARFMELKHADRIKIGGMIMFLLEQMG